MACFLVPAAEAVITVAVTKIIKSKEKDVSAEKLSAEGGSFEEAERIPFSRKLRWLTNLLLGGSVLLAFEHFWHGEIVPYFPFLTAASNPGDTAEMLREMLTVGLTMAAFVTVVWTGMLVVSYVIEKRALRTSAPAKEEA